MRKNANVASLLVLAALGLAGCSQKPSGTYFPSGPTVYEKLEFKDGDIVDVSVMHMAMRGSYKVDGKTVTVSLGLQSAVFEIDDQGCLDGGQMIGKYCRK